MKIIMFSGKAEAGKTTAAEMVKEVLEKEHYRVAIIPYGAYVKETARLVFGWDGKKDEKGRQLLQWWGTDVVRKKYPNFWLETVQRLAMVVQDQLDYMLIDDCRFPNEIDNWKNNWSCLAVRINRPGHENALTPEQRNHPSETSLDNYDFDLTITATDYNTLKYRVQKAGSVFWFDESLFHKPDEMEYYDTL